MSRQDVRWCADETLLSGGDVAMWEKCYRLLYSHITNDYTALETGLFGEKNKCLCSLVYLCECKWVCGVCMYL